MIIGINHVTLAVKNVAASMAFYVAVLGCVPAAKWPEGAYLRAGTLWLALVQDDQVRTGPLPEYSHVAFSVSRKSFPVLCERIRASGAPCWQENQTEGDSSYFLDPDGHKLEIHVTGLNERLEHARSSPWEGLEILEEHAPAGNGRKRLTTGRGKH